MDSRFANSLFTGILVQNALTGVSFGKMSAKRVVVTGASGLLGRAVKAEFDKAGWTCVGTAFSRARDGLEKVDLTERDQVEALISKHNPSIVVHSAAERRPDVVDKRPREAEAMNVVATQYLVDACAKQNVFVLYVSTDYVFDGKAPPYKPTCQPNPLNAYGRLKREGEKVVLKYPNSGVLRVPILYGQVEQLAESSVTALVEGVRRHPEPVKMSNYELRYPTYCPDVAMVIRQISERHLSDPAFTGVWHWSGADCMTKFAMATAIAELFSLPHEHLCADDTPSSGAPRPYDAHLDCTELQSLGFGNQTSFREGMKAALQPYFS